VILSLIMGYLTCIMLAFFVVRRKVSIGSIAMGALIGVVMLAVTVAWKQAAPTTGQMTLRRRVLQVVPDVRGYVSKVYVNSDQKVSKGDPLFEVLPDRFQNSVDEAKATLTSAIATVSQLEAGVTAAEAALKEEKAKTGAAQAEFETAQNLLKANPDAIAGLTVEEKRQALLANQASDKVAEATLKQAQFAVESAKRSVAVAQSSLKTANFNLMRCTYVAPFDGQVVNWQVREGIQVARYRGTAVGTLQSFDDNAVLAVYPQNLLTHVQSGDKVEIAFKSRPGQVVEGKVREVVPYTGEGQMTQTAILPAMSKIGSQGFLAVLIDLDDEQLAKELPLGAAGSTAIYTDFGKSLHIMTRISIRIKAWVYQLLPV
jgi:multidrug resistance efflux pump